MALSTVEIQLQKILEQLKDDTIKTVILIGQPGVGKTWMARELTDCSIKMSLFDFTLWVFLNREYDTMALCQSFARQLDLLSTAKECEDDDYEEEEEEDEEEMELHLQRKISEALAHKSFLLILDDEGKKMNLEQIMFKLETLLNLNLQSSYKVLITTTDNVDSNEDTKRSVIELKPLSKEESLSLLKERADAKVCELPGIEPLVDAYVERSMGLPAAIILIAKALTYFGQCDSGVQKLEIALKEVAYGESFNIALLLRCGYDRLPIGVLIDFCSSGSHFFRDRGTVHYNELIAYWIMEGYLGQVDCIEKAYEEGHHVLMELIDFQLLKTVETDYVVMEGATFNLAECSSCRSGGTACLGLANVFRYGEWEGLGRITQVDGIRRSLCSYKKGRKLSTLLLDGNHIGREIPGYWLQYKEDLQILTVFNPQFKSLPHPLSKMENLNVLVLRGCHVLEKVESMLAFRRLTALEISGPSSLVMIPDNIFRHMPYLRSLNLSALQINSLPLSLYELSELRWLILKGCSRLEKVLSLRRLRNLMVLDLSGATSLEDFQDNTFSQNQELQILNFSKTKIKKLPSISGLRKLTHLLLSGCQQLEKVHSLRSVTSLQIIDFSDSSIFKELKDHTLESIVGLKILDMSGTAVTYLPSNISNPFHLYLKGCTRLRAMQCIEKLHDLETLELSKARLQTLPPLSHLYHLRRLSVSCCLNLKKLPDLNSLQKLEVLDLSGCTALQVIPEKSFEQMYHLHRLDLSETKIARLPSLENLINLHHLLLRKCTQLRVVPPLESLVKLEELNLSGIGCLKKADFLKHMSHLQILDLSDTLLEQLPSMSNLKNLHELYLKGCMRLRIVPDLESLIKLEVLDLSGSSLSLLPSLKNFSSLRQLRLGDCSSLEGFLQLEMLDVLGATSKELPYGISELTNLEHLDLPTMKNTQGASSSRIKEPNHYGWGISSLPAETVGENYKPPVSVSSSLFLQLLENNPSLWNTSFKQFHFSAHHVKEQDRTGVVSFYRDNFMFRDIYFQTRQFFDFVKQRSLEIRGFHHSPMGIKDVLCHADCLFLIDNAFARCLSDLGTSNLNVLKGCWIERCREMETIFHEEDAEKILNLRRLEVLWVSNSLNLKYLYSGKWQWDTFQNLKRLYLDCCPKILIVFYTSHLPINLQVLHIKFCDELRAVFAQASPKPELPNLVTLCLWELPKLHSIGCLLPSLQTQKVGGCPNLVDFEENIKLATSL